MGVQTMQVMTEPEDVQLQARLSDFCSILGDASAWAEQFDSARFLGSQLRRLRHEADRCHRASQRRLCVGMFGQSRAGKSFLVGELGRRGDRGLQVRVGREGRCVSFLEGINPISADEVTAVVSRFTYFPRVVPLGSDTFATRLFSLADVLKCLATGFALDCTPPAMDDPAAVLDDLWSRLPAQGKRDPFLDVMEDAWAYVAASYGEGNPYFASLLGRGDILARLEKVGGPIRDKKVKDQLAATLWGLGQAPAMDELYRRLSDALARLGNPEHAAIDAEAVAPGPQNGKQSDQTVLNQKVLSDLMKGQLGTVQVTPEGDNPRTVEIEIATASALISELYLPVVPAEDGPSVLDKGDILDFPGARAGKAGGGGAGRTPDELQNNTQGHANVVDVFKRGKLTYLFECYCREREITVLGFCYAPRELLECHHVPGQIRRWLGTRYPQFDALDQDELTVPSLFLCLTKFDMLVDPATGLGSQELWNSVIDKLIKFFDRPTGAVEEGLATWFQKWGGRQPFDNLYWVRNPEYLINQRELTEYRDSYMKSRQVVRFVRDHEVKWEAVAPTDVHDRQHTGAALLIDGFMQKLSPDLKRRELIEKLKSMVSELRALLAPRYVAAEGDQRTATARIEAQRLSKLLHDRENRHVFGPLLAAIGLPPNVVHRQLDALSEDDMLPIAAQQEQRFVENLVEGWEKHAREGLEGNGGLVPALGDESIAIGRLLNELATRMRHKSFRDTLGQRLRFFFQNPAGLDRFRHPLTAICCRYWSDFVAQLGCELPAEADPSTPPKLTRDCPWRRYANHWERNLEKLYVENAEGEQAIPPGNAALGTILERVKAMA